MFANTTELLQKAQRGRYAIGHFNFYNLETLQAIVHAAEKLNSPVILATSEGALKYAGGEYLAGLAKIAAEKSKVPLALHLDHGTSLEIVKKVLQAGYSSVMIDASHQSFEKNVALTKAAVKLAHQKHFPVEAELGTIGVIEDHRGKKVILYTDPEKAREFVQRTGCDSLAIAIGTSHGAYKFSGLPELKIDLLKRIQSQVKVPLVLHGASSVPAYLGHLAEKYGASLGAISGVPEEQIKLAVKNGICKVNTDTDLRLAFIGAVRGFLHHHPAEIDPRKILTPARDLMQKVVEERIKLFGSQNKA